MRLNRYQIVGLVWYAFMLTTVVVLAAQGAYMGAAVNALLTVACACRIYAINAKGGPDAR